jgi:hypothetical protein
LTALVSWRERSYVRECVAFSDVWPCAHVLIVLELAVGRSLEMISSEVRYWCGVGGRCCAIMAAENFPVTRKTVV